VCQGKKELQDMVVPVYRIEWGLMRMLVLSHPGFPFAAFHG
jgi:hypothetical protein